MNLRAFLRRIIVRAAPTCTLWSRPDLRTDVLRFRLWPRWNITGLEIAEAGGPMLPAFSTLAPIPQPVRLKPRFDAASPPISELPQRASAALAVVKLKG